MANAATKEMFGPLVIATPPEVVQKDPPIPYMLFASKTVPTATQSRMYSTAEWDAQRPKIEHLYGEGTLATTMAALGAAGFPVTNRQLKRKVMAWGLRKNLKKDEKVAIVRQQAHAEALGEQRFFSLHNALHREITLPRVERMIKRDKITTNLTMGSIPETPPDIEYHTVAEMSVPIAIHGVEHHPDVVNLIDRESCPNHDCYHPLGQEPILLDDNPLPDNKFITVFEGRSHEPALIYEKLQTPSIDADGESLFRNRPYGDYEMLLDDEICLTEDTLHNEKPEIGKVLGYKSVFAGTPIFDGELHLPGINIPGGVVPLNERPLLRGAGLLFDSGSLPDRKPGPEDRSLSKDCHPTKEFSLADPGPSVHKILVDRSLILEKISLPDVESVDDSGALSTSNQPYVLPDVSSIKDMVDVRWRPSETPNTLGDDSRRFSKSVTSSEVILHHGHRRNNRLLSSEEARSRVQNMIRLKKDLSDVLRSIGMPEEEREIPKTRRKRKRATALFLYPTPDASKRVQFRAGVQDCERLYALGFSLARQLDDTLSIMLPPLFDKPYLREREEMEGQKVCEMDRLYGSDDLHTIYALSKLSSTFSYQGRAPLSAYFDHRAGIASRELLGDGNINTLTIFLRLAVSLEYQDKGDEAAKLVDHLESAALHYLGTNHELVQRIRILKANLLHNAGRYVEAEIHYRDHLKFSQEIYGLSHKQTIRTGLNLVNCLRLQGKLGESKEVLEAATRSAKEAKESWSALCILHAENIRCCILIDEGSIEDGERLWQEVEKELRVLRPGIDPNEYIIW